MFFIINVTGELFTMLSISHQGPALADRERFLWYSVLYLHINSAHKIKIHTDYWLNPAATYERTLTVYRRRKRHKHRDIPAVFWACTARKTVRPIVGQRLMPCRRFWSQRAWCLGCPQHSLRHLKQSANLYEVLETSNNMYSQVLVFKWSWTDYCIRVYALFQFPWKKTHHGIRCS